jgi:hypothetical protein
VNAAGEATEDFVRSERARQGEAEPARYAMETDFIARLASSPSGL